MNRLTFSIFILLVLYYPYTFLHAEKNKVTTIKLKYIAAEDAISVLELLKDQSVSIAAEKNVLFIKGTAKKIKSVIPIINEIDKPPIPLKIEFIASKRKIDFKNSSNIYQSSKNKVNIFQSMSIIERQWVTLNSGVSIPVAERKRSSDGTETQSFTYKKVSKKYVFKVHEFSGRSVIQMKLDLSSLSNDVAGAIESTELATSIIGKTGEWLEVASSKSISEDEKSEIYSTGRSNKEHINLYVKVIKN